MSENKEYITRDEDSGSISVATEAVAALVADAIGEVEGVGAMSQNMAEQLSGKKAVRGVRVEEAEQQIVIDVYLMVRYGYAIPEVAQKVQESVMNAVGGMTGFEIKEVNVHVGGISFND